MPDISNPRVNRFLAAVIRPVANSALGIDAVIDAATQTWLEVRAILDAEGVQTGDLLLDDSPIDGTGTLTRGDLEKLVAFLAAYNTLLDAATMQALSIAYTQIDLPGQRR